MREILFRGKREYGKAEWAEGDLIHCKSGVFIEKNDIDSFESVKVIPDTAGQFAGLTDKNGNKIFEGDIVKIEYTGNNRGLDGIGEVVFKDCKFALVWGGHKEVVCLTDFCNVDFEIIGNIHDNPELLKSE